MPDFIKNIFKLIALFCAMALIAYFYPQIEKSLNISKLVKQEEQADKKIPIPWLTEFDTHTFAKEDLHTAEVVANFTEAYFKQKSGNQFLAAASLTLTEFTEAKIEKDRPDTLIYLNNGSGVILKDSFDLQISVPRPAICKAIYNKLAVNPDLEVELTPSETNPSTCDTAKTVHVQKRMPYYARDNATMEDYLNIIGYLLKQNSAQTQTPPDSVNSSGIYKKIAVSLKQVDQKPSDTSFVLHQYAIGLDFKSKTAYAGGLTFEDCTALKYLAPQTTVVVQGECLKSKWNTLTIHLNSV